MGDPVEIKIRGFSLSLRKNEASVLLIEKLWVSILLSA
jgi:ferrous iron transport protein A